MARFPHLSVSSRARKTYRNFASILTTFRPNSVTGTGGQISVVTKSGGNRFHGSGFEYLRRAGLDSRNFFDNVSPGISKSGLTLDQFGGSVGGPIIKDKFFFFGSF